jgi:uncharacterized membrane protein
MRKDLILVGTVCFLAGFFLSPLTTAMRLWLSQSIAGFSDWLVMMGTDWNRGMDLAIQGFYGTSMRIIVMIFAILPIVILLTIIYLVYRWWSRRRGRNEYNS